MHTSDRCTASVLLIIDRLSGTSWLASCGYGIHLKHLRMHQQQLQLLNLQLQMPGSPSSALLYSSSSPCSHTEAYTSTCIMHHSPFPWQGYLQRQVAALMPPSPLVAAHCRVTHALIGTSCMGTGITHAQHTAADHGRVIKGRLQFASQLQHVRVTRCWCDACCSSGLAHPALCRIIRQRSPSQAAACLATVSCSSAVYGALEPATDNSGYALPFLPRCSCQNARSSYHGQTSEA